jgi:hypothetical protein
MNDFKKEKKLFLATSISMILVVSLSVIFVHFRAMNSDKDTMKIMINENQVINDNTVLLNVNPDELYWESSDSNVALVDGKTVKGLKEGSTTITLKDFNGKEYKRITIKVLKDK